MQIRSARRGGGVPTGSQAGGGVVDVRPLSLVEAAVAMRYIQSKTVRAPRIKALERSSIVRMQIRSARRGGGVPTGAWGRGGVVDVRPLSLVDAVVAMRSE